MRSKSSRTKAGSASLPSMNKDMNPTLQKTSEFGVVMNTRSRIGTGNTPWAQWHGCSGQSEAPIIRFIYLQSQRVHGPWGGSRHLSGDGLFGHQRTCEVLRLTEYGLFSYRLGKRFHWH